jgi:adenosine deaminase
MIDRGALREVALDQVRDQLQAFPKVELHLHLDCCLSYEAARTLDPTLSRVEYEEHFVGPTKCKDLMGLLRFVERPLELMQSEEALELVTDDLFDQLQADHVIYAEIRFAPLLHTRHGLSSAGVLESVTTAAAEASVRTGVRYGIIVCTLRHFSEEESLESAHAAVEGAEAGVVGFDIAGDEAGFSLDAHVGAFDVARSGGLALTAHAGETSARNVRETLERLRPGRIAHGVRSIEDPAIVELLKTRRVHLDVCPTSNVQTDVFERLVDHSVQRLLEAGVSLGISTDGRTLCNVSLTDEYQRLHDAFGWDTSTFLRTNRAAAEASFAPDPVKTRLVETLLAATGTVC